MSSALSLLDIFAAIGTCQAGICCIERSKRGRGEIQSDPAAWWRPGKPEEGAPASDPSPKAAEGCRTPKSCPAVSALRYSGHSACHCGTWAAARGVQIPRGTRPDRPVYYAGAARARARRHTPRGNAHPLPLPEPSHARTLRPNLLLTHSAENLPDPLQFLEIRSRYCGCGPRPIAWRQPFLFYLSLFPFPPHPAGRVRPSPGPVLFPVFLSYPASNSTNSHQHPNSSIPA